MGWELLPIRNSARTEQAPGNYNAALESGGKVAALAFVNKGNRSNIVVQYAGVRFVLTPNEALELSAPVGGYDTTNYQWDFVVTAGAGAIFHNLQILIQTYINP